MEILHHNDFKNIVRIVKDGGIIIYPTDTIWGLGCNALDQTATAKLKKLKGKPADAALIWLLPSIQAVEKHCGPTNPTERNLLKQKHTSVIIHGQAVRVIKSGWVPMVATSANVHGQPVITSWHQAVKLFDGQTDAVVRGRKIYKNQPSNLVKVNLKNDQPVIDILRLRDKAECIK